MTAPLLPAHGSAAPLVPPTNVEHGMTRSPEVPCAPPGDGGPEDFTAACRCLSHLFGRNHARQYKP